MSAINGIANVNIWTGDGHVVRDTGVSVFGGRVSAIGPLSPDVPGVLDGQGGWVMPGMIDSHVHLWGARTPHPVHWVVDPRLPNALRSVADIGKILRSGFTTVREAGGPLGPSLRQVIDAGEIEGPRVVPAYLGLSRTGGHGDCHTLPVSWVREQPFMALVVDGPNNLRKAVRTVSREGGRWVKVWASGGVLSERDSPEHMHFGPDELAAIVEEAHAIDLPVGAHCESLAATYAAVEAGVDAIEHGFQLDNDVCEAMRERDVTLVSTLSVLQRYARWSGPEITADQRDDAKRLLAKAEESLATAVRHGVRVAMGSDCFAEPMTPFGRSADELGYMRDVGVDADTILRSATSVAARLVGMESKIGTVAEGAYADLLLLPADPRADLDVVINSSRITAVIKEGRRIA
ncbi:amidohydrolase family protein [Microtetraspora sp. NBRC 16547]|uniref:metal-dependent hydrolase family protein n=1 Tax=Microtetraspora sp. NBRC 16547 TaxID=3030993 RepID=UPI0024A096B3|nr:amidohydrolase family protein [Microtetraspora sp. NBRC 16547]GLW96902.1 amidohydrolase [Microtetraspora sp. NBRC 16547]